MHRLIPALLALLVVHSAQATQVPVDRQLRPPVLAFYDFETLPPTDRSPNGIATSLIGSPLLDANGLEGNALRLDGGSGIRVDLDINPGSHALPQLSMGAFVNLDLVGPNQTLLSCDDGGWDRTLQARQNWGAFRGNGFLAGTPPTPGAWQLVVAVYDGPANRLRLFVDGALVTEGGTYNPCGVGAGFGFPFVDVGLNPGFGQGLVGRVDNAFFYEGLLDEAQIQEILVGGSQAILETVPKNVERRISKVDGFLRWPTADEWILPGAQAPFGSQVWSYTAVDPGPGWVAPDHDDSAWATGRGGFGTRIVEIDQVETPWDAAGSPALWLRAEFQLSEADLALAEHSPISLWGRWDNTLEVHVNGEPGAEAGMNVDYRHWPLHSAAIDSLRAGANTIAVRVENTCGGLGYLDLAIVRNPYAGSPFVGSSSNAITDQFLDVARRFVEEEHIPTLSFAVARDDVLVSHYTIGYLDGAQRIPAPQNTYFRMASINKPVISAAWNHLFSASHFDGPSGMLLTPSTPIEPLMLSRGVGPPPGVQPDSDFSQVLLGEMIAHQSLLPGALGMGAEEAWELKAVEPEQFGHEEWLGVLYGLPLRTEPLDYNNVAYGALLALFDVMQPNGEGFLEFVNEHILDTSGSGCDPMIFSQVLPGRRPQEEGGYRTWQWPQETSTMYAVGGGGTAVTAETYAHFSSRYYLNETISQPLSPGGGTYTQWKSGKGSAVQNVAWQQTQGGHVTAFVILTNQGRAGTEPIRIEFAQLVATIGDNDWF